MWVEQRKSNMISNELLLRIYLKARQLKPKPLRNKMNGMKGMFPMMFTMGIVNGAMMSQMLHMNHMDMIGYFVDQPILIDYLNDPSGEPYTDGSGGDLDGGSEV